MIRRPFTKIVKGQDSRRLKQSQANPFRNIGCVDSARPCEGEVFLPGQPHAGSLSVRSCFAE